MTKNVYRTGNYAFKQFSSKNRCSTAYLMYESMIHWQMTMNNKWHCHSLKASCKAEADCSHSEKVRVGSGSRGNCGAE